MKSLRLAHNAGLVLLTVWFVVQLDKDPSATDSLKIFLWTGLWLAAWTVFIILLHSVEVLWKVWKERYVKR